jgi:hypothetical protein
VGKEAKAARLEGRRLGEGVERGAVEIHQRQLIAQVVGLAVAQARREGGLAAAFVAQEQRRAFAAGEPGAMQRGAAAPGGDREPDERALEQGGQGVGRRARRPRSAVHAQQARAKIDVQGGGAAQAVGAEDLERPSNGWMHADGDSADQISGGGGGRAGAAGLSRTSRRPSSWSRRR